MVETEGLTPQQNHPARCSWRIEPDWEWCPHNDTKRAESQICGAYFSQTSKTYSASFFGLATGKSKALFRTHHVPVDTTMVSMNLAIVFPSSRGALARSPGEITRWA